MSKIIRITEEIVYIGNEDNSITEVTSSSLEFEPNVGDEVDVFKNDKEIFVTKKDAKKEEVVSKVSEGISVNINNSNTNAAADNIYIPSGRVVNKLTYVLLAIFLGGIGGHKFYSGQVGLGVLYLIFSITLIPSVALIEAITAGLKPADVNGNIVL